MRKNIVLIGMSGSGKTTIGKMLSEKLGMDFADTDELIEKKENRKITDIFSSNGEKFFRDSETFCAKETSSLLNTIISTGGGIVLREENMSYLKKNGCVIYLKRSVESIKETMDASNRPLLKDGLSKLYDMEKIRGPLYEKYADLIVVNEKEPQLVIEEITDYLKNFNNI